MTFYCLLFLSIPVSFLVLLYFCVSLLTDLKHMGGVCTILTCKVYLLDVCLFALQALLLNGVNYPALQALFLGNVSPDRQLSDITMSISQSTR